MHHWRVHEKVDFPKFPPDTGVGWGSIPQLFHPELRNEVQKFSYVGQGGIFHNF